MIPLLLSVVSLSGSPSAPAAPRLWAGLAPGPYAVGTRRIDTAGGPVRAWYPARDGGGVALRFRDYVGDGTGDLRTFLAGTGVPAATIDALLAEPLAARDAPPPAAGSFPIVLVAQGNGEDAVDQVVLCEALASRGLVVATTPSPTIGTPLEREDQVGAFAEMQAADLRAAATVIAGRLPADPRRVGVVGHSFGARSALLLAMRDPCVAAVVSLDGGIGTATAVEPLRRAPSFDAEAKLPPLLHFFERLDAFMAPDFALLESLDIAELTLEPTEGMHHVHFTTWGFAAAAYPEIADVTHATPETAGSVVAVAERTADFLLRHLR